MKNLFFVFIFISFTARGMEQNPFELIPQEMQEYIAQFLLCNGFDKTWESDDKLKKVLKNPDKRKNDLKAIYDYYTMSFITEYSFSNEKYNIFLTNYATALHAYFKKEEIMATLLDLVPTRPYPENASYSTCTFVVSPSFTCVLALSKKNYKSENFYVISLPSRKIQAIPLPECLEPQKILANSQQEAINLSAQGYIETSFTFPPNSWEMEKPIDGIAITNDGKTIAFYDPGSVYCFNVDNPEKCMVLKKFSVDTGRISLPGYLRRSKYIERLEFNQQGTKLGIKYTENGQQQLGTDIELFDVPGAKPPKKTLKALLRQNLVCNSLGSSSSPVTNCNN